MSKFCLAIFATAVFICGFVKHTGLPDSANSTTRQPGPERILSIKTWRRQTRMTMLLTPRALPGK